MNMESNISVNSNSNNDVGTTTSSIFRIEPTVDSTTILNRMRTMYPHKISDVVIDPSEYKVYNPGKNEPKMMPIHLMLMSFRTSVPLNDAIHIIEDVLQNIKHLNYTREDHCVHKCTCMIDDIFFKFEINIFTHKDSLIIETNRLSGDPFMLNKIHDILRRKFNGENVDIASFELNSFKPANVPEDLSVVLTEEEEDNALLPFINLLNDKNKYNNAMAFQVLY